jgi:hypothetical protein
MVFRHTIAVGKTHRIPTLEMALVSKFLAMNGPTRRPDKRLIDAGDFTNLVLHNRNVIDLKKLKQLGDKALPRGGSGILRLIEEIDAGRTIQVS